MKCAYKQAMESKALGDATESMLSVYLGISVCALRELFGFGFKRLSKYSKEMVEDAEQIFSQYQDGDDVADGVLTSYYAARRAVKDLGVDLDLIERETRCDAFESLWGGAARRKRVEDRRDYLTRIERTVGTLWLLTMLWLHDEYGFGYERLGRYYRKCQETLMTEFSAPYLQLKNETLQKFFDDLKQKCEEFGVAV